jgi:hypothetical protein
MKLLTKEIEAKLAKAPLRSQENNPNPEIIVKFFMPEGNWTWYVTEAEKGVDGNWMFYGLVNGHEQELGYFTLSELQSLRTPNFRLPVERDMYFNGKHLKDVQK